MNTDVIQKTKNFMKEAFIEHPHYSFNHWSVMYDHSILVQSLALQIADEIDCDKTIVAIASLLHDI
jgi:HD superfamily phosphodiesterase